LFVEWDVWGLVVSGNLPEKNMNIKALVLLQVAVAAVMALSAVNLTGKWVGNLPVPHSMDSVAVIYNLEQAGDSLTGSLTGPDGVMEINNGKVMGDKFSFSIASGMHGATIDGVYLGDSLRSNITLTSGKVLHLTLVRGK
jgi:hypothetical protein